MVLLRKFGANVTVETCREEPPELPPSFASDPAAGGFRSSSKVLMGTTSTPVLQKVIIHVRVHA